MRGLSRRGFEARGYATPGGAVQGDPALQYAIGDSYPNLTYTQHIFESSLVVTVSQQLATRFYYRFEKTSTDDWHYSGLDRNLMVPSNNGMGSNGVIFLDPGPRKSRVDVPGVMLQYRL